MPANPWIASLADAFINNALSALGAGARALENPGEFLRDDLPPGTGGLTLWIQDRNRRACRRHARNEAAGLYSGLGALRRPRYGHCQPYLDSINEGPEEEGSYAPPFTGGQCPGVKYRLQASGTWYVNYPPPQGPSPSIPWSTDVLCTDFVNTLLGPITAGVRRNSQGRPSFRWEGGNNKQYTSLFIDDSRGVINVSSISVLPCSGTDNCGNPPP